MLNEEKILARANELYTEAKNKKHPGLGPVEIQMDSLKAVLSAIVEAVNARVQY